MSFADLINKNPSELRVLVEFDLPRINSQWINIGAGIWYINFYALYPQVDPLLLDGFFSQIIGDVGSVAVDGEYYTKVNTLLDVTNTNRAFYFDNEIELFVHMRDNDDPYLHNVVIGAIYGTSYTDFFPKGSAVIYEGRLASRVILSQSRDKLYFGKLQYDTSDIEVINNDGFFNDYGESSTLFGNPVRVRIGFDELDISDYVYLYQGTIEKVSIDERSMNVSVVDNRKLLTKKTAYTCTNKNALDAIVELLIDEYEIAYTDVYFNTTDWDIITALVDNVTIINDQNQLPTVIELIELICTSVFGLFIIETDNRYSFKLIDSSASSETSITRYDILNDFINIEYDPSEVLSSVRIGYDRNVNLATNDSMTWLQDTTYETAVYLKYKIYKEVDFKTCLNSQVAAQSLANIILSYAKDIHGTFEIEIPIKYYNYNIAHNIDVDINKINNDPIIGTKKCEILSKNIDLDEKIITMELRII